MRFMILDKTEVNIDDGLKPPHILVEARTIKPKRWKRSTWFPLAKTCNQNTQSERTKLQAGKPRIAATSLAVALGLALSLASDIDAIEPHRHEAIGSAAHRQDLVKKTVAEVRQVTLVTNCNDSGIGSLRQAYANAADNQVIDLSQLVCSRITFTPGALVDLPSAANGTL